MAGITSPEPGRLAVRFDRTTKRSGDLVALDALDLEVAPGEIVGLLGPNGAGKTTALRSLLGLIWPSGGRAEIFGLDAWQHPAEAHRHLAYIPGDFAVWPQLAGSRSRTNGIIGAVLGITLLTRVLAASSAAPDWLWAATPFGWTTYLHEADGARPAVFATFTVVVITLTVAALALGRRDLHGARLTTDHDHPDARPIGGLGGLAAHTTRGPATAWGRHTRDLRDRVRADGRRHGRSDG